MVAKAGFATNFFYKLKRRRAEAFVTICFSDGQLIHKPITTVEFQTCLPTGRLKPNVRTICQNAAKLQPQSSQRSRAPTKMFPTNLHESARMENKMISVDSCRFVGNGVF